MSSVLNIQGRDLCTSDLELIQRLIGEHPDWSRWRVSRVLAEHWHWRTATGQLKDMATRSLLLKLDQRGLIRLPAKRSRGGRQVCTPATTLPALEHIQTELAQLQPVQVRLVQPRTEGARRFRAYLCTYHYLG